MATKLWLGTTSGDYSVAANWSPAAVPVSTNDVRLSPDYNNPINAGLAQSGVAIGDFIVEKGFTAAIGSVAAGYLAIDPNRFEFAGGGVSYVDLSGAAISVLVRGTAAGSAGKAGLYLLGSAIATLTQLAGSVALAGRLAETATAATLSLQGGELWAGEGCTLTTLRQLGGTSRIRAALATAQLYGGKLYLEEESALATLNGFGGTCFWNSSGGITSNANLEGCTLNALGNGTARTLAAIKLNAGASFQYDPDVVTVTAFTAPDQAIALNAKAA